MRPAQLRADEIDSRTLCVSVDARRVDAITDAVRSFHERLSPDAFVERQAARVRSDGFLSPARLGPDARAALAEPVFRLHVLGSGRKADRIDLSEVPVEERRCQVLHSRKM